MVIQKRQPTHPGRILKRHYFEPLTLTITEVADNIGVSRKTLSEIINERGSITPDSPKFECTPLTAVDHRQRFFVCYLV